MREPFLLGVLLFGSWLAMPTWAQPLHLRLYGGLETHGHGDLKRLQEQQQQLVNLGNDLKIVEAYPAHIGVGGELVLAFGSSSKVGIVAGYSSTGGRLHYADYSGEVQLDQVLRRWYGGATFEMKVVPKGPLWLMMQLRYSRSELVATSLIRLGDEALTGEDQLAGEGASFAPGIVLELRQGPFEVRLVAGFEYSFIFPFLPSSLSNTLYLEEQETNLHAEWSGLRFGISVGGIANRFGR